jgi:hypothetical protein
VASVAASSSIGCRSPAPSGGADPPASLQSAPEKIQQLVGDLDRQTNPPAPTRNLTATRVGLVGTDLGYSFVHKGRMYFLFGDGIPVNAVGERIMNSDPIATSAIPDGTSSGIEGGLDLEFLTDADGQYHPVLLDGHSLGTVSLPETGLSTGADMVVFFGIHPPTTCHVCQGGRSVIGVSHDDGRTFASVALVPNVNMANLFPLLRTSSDVPGVPSAWAQVALVYGQSGTGNDTYVAAAPLDRLTDTTTWLYFTGLTGGAPTWSAEVASAAPLFEANTSSGCGGAFSLTLLRGLTDAQGVDRWLLLHRCDGPHAILYRVAATPFGPFSEERTFFDPQRDGGLCHFMHRGCDPSVNDPASPSWCCDADYQPLVLDPDGKPTWGPGASAYPYAPYVIEQVWDPSRGAVLLYFLTSVFNPYSPMVMRAIIRPQDVALASPN